MPELPEVETSRRGIEPAILGKTFTGAVVRNASLRWPVPENLSQTIQNQSILAVKRRAKYLLIELSSGTVILHLGMSGRLRVVQSTVTPAKHDHVDLLLDDGHCLRLNDARRFGAVLWQPHPAEANPLLSSLGPEPLEAPFTGAYLYQRSRGLRGAVKNFIMDQKTVVGVGNIYASESLFRAGIHPSRAAGRIGLARYEKLAEAIRQVLTAAIARGGTTLRDYIGPDGNPGYFKLDLDVYEQAGKPCARCGTAISRRVIGQRASYFCAHCQT